MPEYRN